MNRFCNVKYYPQSYSVAIFVAVDITNQVLQNPTVPQRVTKLSEACFCVNKLLRIQSVVFPIRQFSDVTLFNIRQLMTSVDQAVNMRIFQFHIFSCLVMVLKSDSIQNIS